MKPFHIYSLAYWLVHKLHCTGIIAATYVVVLIAVNRFNRPKPDNYLTDKTLSLISNHCMLAQLHRKSMHCISCSNQVYFISGLYTFSIILRTFACVRTQCQNIFIVTAFTYISTPFKLIVQIFNWLLSLFKDQMILL